MFASVFFLLDFSDNWVWSVSNSCNFIVKMNQMINGFPLLSVMGNATGKKEGEGSSSGVNNFEENYDVESAEPMVHSPPHNSFASQVSSFLFSIFQKFHVCM